MLFAVPLVPLLADAAPAASDPASYQSAGWLLLGLAGLAGAVNQILGVFEKLKAMKAPEPGTVSADRVDALEKRMHSVEIQIAQHMGGIDSKFQSINQTLTALQTDWSYQIGRLDGQRESAPH